MLAAAQRAGLDLERAPDVTVLMEPVTSERDVRVLAAMHAYVRLHPACEGHARIACGRGTPVIEPGDGGVRRCLLDLAPAPVA